MATLLFILMFTIMSSYARAANILIVIPFSSKSHYIMLRPIGLELVKRGHNITVITAITEPNPPPNYHEVVVDYTEIWDLMGTKRPVVFDMAHKKFEEFYNDVLWQGGLAFTEWVLKSDSFQEFLRKNNTFDLIFNEQFFQESFNILAYKYKAPLVVASTLGNCMKHNFVVGNPLQLNTIIFETLKLTDHTSIWGRLRNVYVAMYEYFWWKYWYLGKQEALMRKYIPDLEEPMPTLFEMQKYVSLLFINYHYSFDPPMALLPNIIEVGGMHMDNSLRSNASLPKDLQDALDRAHNGFIYMNFGSNVRISEMEKSKKLAFFNVFGKLNHTVLMKWEEEVIHHKPDNVIVRKWFPQQQIFAHPNIKLFISHGGLISTQEAMYYGVPILGVPIYGDQYNNVELTEKHGFGKILEFHNINEKTLEDAVNKMLNDASYRKNAKEMSKRFYDRPMNSLDTTIWWLEYVMRYNGAHFMKSSTMDMSWFKYFMLDVYLALIAMILLVIYVMVILMKVFRTIKGLFRSQNQQKKKKK